jgi:hypothetical protein
MKSTIMNKEKSCCTTWSVTWLIVYSITIFNSIGKSEHTNNIEYTYEKTLNPKNKIYRVYAVGILYIMIYCIGIKYQYEP